MKMVSIIAALLSLGIVTAHTEESFRLVHAIGNNERILARGLSKSECERRKLEHEAITAILSGGSVACLPESVFRD